MKFVLALALWRCCCAMSVGVAQILVLDSDHSGNLHRATQAIMRAKAMGADVVVLPEGALLGQGNPAAWTLGCPVPGCDTLPLAALARELSVGICVGVAERVNSTTMFNSAVLIDGTGDVRVVHRQINTVPGLIEPPFTPGPFTTDTPLVVTMACCGRVAVLLGADLERADVVAAVARQRPDVVLAPVAWAGNTTQWPVQGPALVYHTSQLALAVGAPVVVVNSVSAMAHNQWLGNYTEGWSTVAMADGTTLVIGADSAVDVQVADLRGGRAVVRRPPLPRLPRRALTGSTAPVRLAVAQIAVLYGDKTGNKRRIERAVVQAKEAGADAVMLPEASLLGYLNEAAWVESDPIPGGDSRFLQNLAKSARILLAVGLVERVDNETLFNSALLISETGEILIHHRKIHVVAPFPIYTPGPLNASNVKVVLTTCCGRVGVLTCADIHSAQVLDLMAPQRPDLVLVPFGWGANASAWPAQGAVFPPLVLPAAARLGATIAIANSVGQINTAPLPALVGQVFGGWSLVANASSVTMGTGADRDVDLLIVDLPPLKDW